MDDALARVPEREVSERADLTHVGIQGLDLLARDRILDAALPVIGRSVVIGGGDDRTDPPRLAPSELQSLKSLRAGDLVYQVTINVDQCRTVDLFMDDVTGPKLFVQGLSCHPV